MSFRIEDDPWVGTPTVAPRRSLSRRVWWGLAACGVIAVLALVGGGVLVYGLMERPRPYVVAHDNVPAKTVAWLTTCELLEPGESVTHFYSDGTWNERSSGCFSTNRRVVKYAETPGSERTVEQVRYRDLARFARRTTDVSGKTVELEFVPEVGEPVTLVLPTRRGGDRSFEDGVRTAWRFARPEVAYAADGLWFPDGAAPESVLAFLTEQSVLLEGERPLALFGAAGNPLTTWGTFCSSCRLVVYSFEPGKAAVHWNLALDDVDTLEFIPGDSSGKRKARLSVRTRGGQEYPLDGDWKLLQLFKPHVEAALEAARGK